MIGSRARKGRAPYADLIRYAGQELLLEAHGRPELSIAQPLDKKPPSMAHATAWVLDVTSSLLKMF